MSTGANGLGFVFLCIFFSFPSSSPSCSLFFFPFSFVLWKFPGTDLQCLSNKQNIMQFLAVLKRVFIML